MGLKNRRKASKTEASDISSEFLPSSKNQLTMGLERRMMVSKSDSYDISSEFRSGPEYQQTMDLHKRRVESEIEASDISSEFPSSPENKLTMTLASFSFSMALAQLSFPQQYMNGKPVPPSLFKQHPSMFEALVIFNMFSFTSSFSLLLIRNKPEFATLRKCYFLISTVSSALVTSLMTVALILASFNKVSSQINLWLNQYGLSPALRTLSGAQS